MSYQPVLRSLARHVHEENQRLREMAESGDTSLTVEAVGSCWAHRGRHDHFDGKCRFVCDECGCRIIGTWGSGPVCVCCIVFTDDPISGSSA